MLQGRTAIVTGGSRGIGRAVAAILLDAGASVVVTARKAAGLQEAATALGGTEVAGRLLTIPAHAADPAAIEQCVRAAIDRFGSVDILVNSAATSPYLGPLLGLDAARAEKMTALNQYAPLVWARHAWDAWMSEHGGCIVNVSSMGAGRVEHGFAYYNATKAALEHLTRSLAFELAPRVRVNAIAPGVVRTDLSRALWEEHEVRVADEIPLRRLGEPDDIAKAVRFLVSDDASWITGATLVVDGGSMVTPRPLMSS